MPSVAVGTTFIKDERWDEKETSDMKEKGKSKIMQLLSKVSQALKDFKTAIRQAVEEKRLESKQRIEEKVVKNKLKR